VFLWVLVVLMLVNAALLTTLYFVYPRDVRKVTATLEQHRTQAMSHS